MYVFMHEMKIFLQCLNQRGCKVQKYSPRIVQKVTVQSIRMCVSVLLFSCPVWTTTCRCVLHQVGIQNYSAASSCQSRPSQTRSDYGKLFVVLVIIGSVCMVIITSGFIYICWQRRLPATKTTVRKHPVVEVHILIRGSSRGLKKYLKVKIKTLKKP